MAITSPAEAAQRAFILLDYLTEYQLFTFETPGVPTLTDGVTDEDVKAIQAAFAALEVLVRYGESDDWTLAHGVAAARFALATASPTRGVLRRHIAQSIELVDEALSRLAAAQVALALEEAPRWLYEQHSLQISG